LVGLLNRLVHLWRDAAWRWHVIAMYIAIALFIGLLFLLPVLITSAKVVNYRNRMRDELSGDARALGDMERQRVWPSGSASFTFLMTMLALTLSLPCIEIALWIQTGRYATFSEVVDKWWWV